jgi:pilus assembly protein Flp/PilA
VLENRAQNLATRFSRDESGATSIEYALIALFIFLAIVASVRLLGPSLVAIFTDARDGLTSAGS